ncbi:hypothetical protein EV426DRAFT_572657 [Tirmania nivea]|nr:hypothetical protein EV426DRAFT_572657 [Tirmania nivea]
MDITPTTNSSLPTMSTSTRTSISGPSPASVMDPEGDVVLLIPTDKGNARFQINSSTLCVVSPVFRAMIGRYSRFKEASALAGTKANESHTPYELTLEDDNQNALAVVLRIIHMKNHLVPKHLDEDQLYEVAVICDKYDMSQAVMLWTDRWIAALVQNESAKPPTVVGHKWLFISYVFARKELFHKLSQELIFTATTSTDDSTALLMTAKDGSGMNDYIPDSILGEIATCRQQSIESMIDCVHRAVDKYRQPGSEVRQCKSSTKEEACDSLVLGFLIRALTLKGVYPIASSEVMHKSTRDIKGILGDMTFPSKIFFMDNLGMNCGYCSRSYGYSRQTNINGYCGNCGRTEPAMPASSNHSLSCSPIANLNKDIQAIYDSIVGLSLDTFSRIKKEGETDAYVAAEGKTLWEL